MRKFIIYSKTASTSSRIGDLRNAGRWDILLHSIISSLFASNEFRNDVELHIIAMGNPNPPKHITIKYAEGNSISKKDLKKLIEIAFRKYKKGISKEVHPGVFIDDKEIFDVIEKEIAIGKNVYMLDSSGEHIKKIKKENLEKGVFVLGDFDGFDKKTKKLLKKNTKTLSLGNQIYFTSQAITIINYELDNL